MNLNRIVALNMILSGQLAGDEEIQRFQAEAEAAANLDHPGSVPIFEIGEHEGQHYFSMAFVDGESLQDRIQQPLPPNEAARLSISICDAVAYAHEKGVIHRDLKPPVSQRIVSGVGLVCSRRTHHCTTGFPHRTWLALGEAASVARRLFPKELNLAPGYQADAYAHNRQIDKAVPITNKATNWILTTAGGCTSLAVHCWRRTIVKA